MNSNSLELVLERLTEADCRPRKGGSQYSARCPAHDDRNPSLSVKHDGEKVLINCHLGCHIDDILGALNLNASDLFDEKKAETNGAARAPQIVATYDYVDLDGRVLFQKVRYVPKTFKVRRPDGRGGWIWGIGDSARVLYRLPEVTAAVEAGQPIFICEGEKDCDRLATMGVVGTCNFDGAAQVAQRPKWRDEYSEVLRGATVLIVADMDMPGHAHADAVAASLRGKAKTVGRFQPMVDFPGADLSDHLDAGYSLQELVPWNKDKATEHLDDEDTSNPPPAPDPIMFRGVLGDCVRFIEPHTEADPVGILVTLLSKVGGLIGPDPHLMVGPTRHPLLIWPILFGRSGTGAKGEAESAAALMVRRGCPEVKDLTSGGMSTGEGLIERIKDPPLEPLDPSGGGKKPKSVEWTGTNDKRLIITEEEFATVLARSNRETNTLGMILRLAWAGGRLSVLNRTAYLASSSHIAIVAHITPREFRIRRKETDMAGGTLNRFLPVWVERSKSLPVPPPIDDKELAAVTWKLADAVEAAKEITHISMDRSATELWTDELYGEFRGGDDEDTAASDFTKRAAPYCLRIAGLFAVLDGRHLINADDLAAAAALVRYSMKTALYVLDVTPRDPRMDRLRRKLDATPEGLTKSEISALFSRKLKAKLLDELLTQLLEVGQYERIEESTGGRTATRYRRKT